LQRLRAPNPLFVGFMSALTTHFSIVGPGVNVPRVLREMVDDGSEANILRSFKMRLADEYPPLYSVFTAVICWIDQSLVPAFPVGDAFATFLAY
jgi:hypothetical protein